MTTRDGRQFTGVRCADRGFPADAGRPGAEVIDARAGVKARNSRSGGAGGRPFSGADRFIGRADELRQVLTACVAAERGHGSLVVVSGEAGIGKSRFCEEAMGRARHGGLTVVYARCWVDGGAPALWPWQQILAGICGADALELLERDARMVAAGPGRFGRFVALTDQLAVACRRSPACVIIDDVHAADPSALLLRFVARSLARVRLALVIMRRRDYRRGDGSATLLDEIEREGTRLGLRRFDLTETTEFLAAHGLGDLDPALFLVLLRVTRGNPLFLRRVAALAPRAVAKHSGSARIASAASATTHFQLWGRPYQSGQLFTTGGDSGLPLREYAKRIASTWGDIEAFPSRRRRRAHAAGMSRGAGPQ